MQVVLIVLFSVSLSFAAGGFTKSIVPYHIQLSQEPPVIKTDYVITQLELFDNIGLKIAMAPILLWMESGLLIYEKTYTQLLETYTTPLRKAQLAIILSKLATGKTITTVDNEILTMNFSGLFSISSPPFVYNFQTHEASTKAFTNLSTKKLSGSIKEKKQVAKIILKISDKYNAFMLLPTDGYPLTIDGIILPPMIFVEYAGLLVAYTFDFQTGIIKFFEPNNSSASCKNQKYESYQHRSYYDNDVTPCPYLVTKIPNELSKDISKIYEIYTKFLEGKYNEK